MDDLICRVFFSACAWIGGRTFANHQTGKRADDEPMYTPSGSSIQKMREHRTGGFLSSSSNWKKSKN